MTGGGAGLLDLWDWRRRVFALYAAIRADPDPHAAWRHWREVRDGLFAAHPQSPIEPAARPGFRGLPVFAYDPALRFTVGLAPLPDRTEEEFPAGEDGILRLVPFARTEGLAAPLGRELTLYWIAGYGGGVFLPFADATAGRDTYGAGRYLLDTIKGADLGSVGDGDGDGRLILDFNFAYNPSCAYSPRYVCPLAPPGNRLPGAVRGGEQAPTPRTTTLGTTTPGAAGP